MRNDKDICIYTSYFGNAKKILESFPDACLVSIAGKTPDWIDCIKYKKLAPQHSWWKEWYDTFRCNLDSDESTSWYVGKYNKTILEKLDANDVANELKSIAGNSVVFLLCYETPEKFCHMHIVAEWLKNNGIRCEEWTDEDKN